MKKEFDHKIPLGDRIYNSSIISDLFAQLPDLTSKKKLWYQTEHHIKQYDPNYSKYQRFNDKILSPSTSTIAVGIGTISTLLIGSANLLAISISAIIPIIQASSLLCKNVYVKKQSKRIAQEIQKTHAEQASLAAAVLTEKEEDLFQTHLFQGTFNRETIDNDYFAIISDLLLKICEIGEKYQNSFNTNTNQYFVNSNPYLDEELMKQKEVLIRLLRLLLNDCNNVWHIIYNNQNLIPATISLIRKYDPDFCINLQCLKTLEIHPIE